MEAMPAGQHLSTYWIGFDYILWCVYLTLGIFLLLLLLLALSSRCCVLIIKMKEQVKYVWKKKMMI